MRSAARFHANQFNLQVRGELQNFYGTLIVDTIGIGLAAAGFLNPLLATFIHVASELTFILNSTRLLRPRERDKISSHQQEPVHA
jgi:hypothetical protein